MAAAIEDAVVLAPEQPAIMTDATMPPDPNNDATRGSVAQKSNGSVEESNNMDIDMAADSESTDSEQRRIKTPTGKRCVSFAPVLSVDAEAASDYASSSVISISAATASLEPASIATPVVAVRPAPVEDDDVVVPPAYCCCCVWCCNCCCNVLYSLPCMMPEPEQKQQQQQQIERGTSGAEAEQMERA